MTNRLFRAAGFLVAPVLIATTVLTQSSSSPAGGTFPPNTVGLEGLPRVRIDATMNRVSRRELDATEAAKSRLTITILDGRLYEGDRTGTPLTMTSSGGFTYLSSSTPGRYIRLQRLNDMFSYVEHVDMAFGSVTYWGELRLVLKK
jgi:hypothetical protein